MIYIKSCPVANRHGRKIMFRREQERIIMEQDKRVEDKKVRFILLITQVVLWFMVMVMEMVVLIVKQINVSEHMLFLVSINLITIVTILINVHNYRKNKKRM